MTMLGPAICLPGAADNAHSRHPTADGRPALHSYSRTEPAIGHESCTELTLSSLQLYHSTLSMQLSIKACIDSLVVHIYSTSHGLDKTNSNLSLCSRLLSMSTDTSQVLVIFNTNTASVISRLRLDLAKSSPPHEPCIGLKLLKAEGGKHVSDTAWMPKSVYNNGCATVSAN